MASKSELEKEHKAALEELARQSVDNASQRAENALLRAEIGRLTHLLEELQKNLQLSLDGNVGLRQQLQELQTKIDALLAKKKTRDRKEFGPKGERHNPRPATGDKEKAETEDGTKENEDDSLSAQKLFQNEPDDVKTHNLSETERICPQCDCETVFVGYRVTQQLEALLRSLQHIEHKQEVRSCPKCKTYIKTAARPPISPIPGSYAGPVLIATTVVHKVDDALPNYRQQKMTARENNAVPRSTQSDWMIKMAQDCGPLYDLLNQTLLHSHVVQTDETHIKVQDRTKKENIRKAKMIACRGDDEHPYVSFIFSPTLSFDVNKKFFEGFTGTIQADAATGFDALFTGTKAIEAGCNAHGRRPVYDAKLTAPEIADRILKLYSAVYKIEKRAKQLTPERRRALRRHFSKPIMREIRRLHVKNKARFSPSHPLYQAAAYNLRHWRALTRFLCDPAVAIDNNAIEREIKYLVIARKNFLFCGSDEGAKALAIHSSLVASARRNKLNPIEYLADVFSRINDMKTSELYKLLPDQWTKFRQPPP
jgi:transposase